MFPITDPRMSRFISLDQGVSFVLSNLSIMRGGEIFIPKIPSLKIVDLAKAINPNCDLKIIGMRPGEKVHEILLSKEEAAYTTEKKDRYIVFPSFDFRYNKKKINLSNLDESFFLRKR